jgi:hypothetical protein
MGASKEESTPVELGAVLTGIVLTALPVILVHTSLEMLPVPEQAVVVPFTVMFTTEEVVDKFMLSIALAVSW